MSENPIQKLSDALKTTKEKLQKIVAHTLSDDKEPLAGIVDDLNSLSYTISDIHGIYQKIRDERDNALKKQVEIENWQTTDSQYDLKKLRLGVRVFAPNESCKSPKGKHWLCAHCFGNQKKSILQLQRGSPNNLRSFGRYSLDCPHCKTSLDVDVEDFQDYNAP